MARGRAPPPAPGRHPPPLPLRRCACSGQKSGMRGPFRPLRSGFCPPARAPLFAPPLPSARPRSGLRPRCAGRSPRRSPPWLSGSGCRAGPRPPLRRLPAPRRLAAPPAAASGGSVPGPSPRSLRSALGCCGWASGPPSAPLRPPCVPLGGVRRRGPPVGPGPRPALPRPSVGWSLWARLRASRRWALRGSGPGPRAALRAAFPAPGPGPFWGLGLRRCGGAVPPPAAAVKGQAGPAGRALDPRPLRG